jgi:hypothetical protein
MNLEEGMYQSAVRYGMARWLREGKIEGGRRGGCISDNQQQQQRSSAGRITAAAASCW